MKRDIVSDNPPASRFLRRAFQASRFIPTEISEVSREAHKRLGIVIGDYLFIDGGEISQLVDGTPDPGFDWYYSRQGRGTVLTQTITKTY